MCCTDINFLSSRSSWACARLHSVPHCTDLIYTHGTTHRISLHATTNPPLCPNKFARYSLPPSLSKKKGGGLTDESINPTR